MKNIFNRIYFHALPDILFYKRLNTVKQEYFCYEWIKRHLEWSYKSVTNDDTHNYSVEDDQTIFVYWKQGWGNAPDIVKKCIESVKANACHHPVILLDENNVRDYVIMPDFIERKHQDGHIKEALYSDLLRLSLLIKYGGCWIDATCFLSKQIPQYLFDSGFFMFSSSHLAGNLSPIEGSSWFIISSKNGGGVLLKRIQNFLFNYYKENSQPINYYIFHLILSVLVNEDEECEIIWENKPYICNMNPHVLQFSLSQEYNADRYNFIIEQCFIHKLTYKFDKQLLNRKSSIFKYFINSL